MKIFLKTGLMLFFLSAILLYGCSDNPANSKNNRVEATVFDNYIVVQHYLSRPIYYKAIESETAALINWAVVSTDENKIKPNRQKNIFFEDIYKYEKGKKIIFFYWTGQEPGANSIKSLVIDT